VGALDVFTNADKPESQLDIKAPAFSVTKIGTTFAALLSVVTAGLPAALRADQTIRVAAIAAATVVMLGAVALWGVDLIVRQRAAEAKLRYGGKGNHDDNGSAPARYVAYPDSNDLKLQVGSSTDEYEIHGVEVDDGEVTLQARHNGKPPLEEKFTPPRRR
jgi:hypothetical protein